jgi:hypothetical protein
MTLAVNIAQGGSNNVTMRNRIINGAMVIDQRNAGASVSGTSGVYTLDRWDVQNNSGAARFNVQQNAGSVTPPAGFVNYLGVTSTGAYTVASSDVISIRQKIEGYNAADLNWGSGNAKTVTLSFQVYSSLTGTFGGALKNGNASYAYPFTYTISSANTWTTISITVVGAPASTWLTTNGNAIEIYFSMGTGSTFLGTAGSWSANDYRSATGGTNVVATNGATFYITGVQLEAGTTASPFEYRQYGTELNLCQRYYWKNFPGGGSYAVSSGTAYTTTSTLMYCAYPVQMRSLPTGAASAASDFLLVYGGAGAAAPSALAFIGGYLSARIDATIPGGITSGSGVFMQTGNSSAWLSFSAEL